MDRLNFKWHISISGFLIRFTHKNNEIHLHEKNIQLRNEQTK